MENSDASIVRSEPIKSFKPWGDVTDPGNHDATKFRYLVHAINPAAFMSVVPLGLKIAMDNPSDINKKDGDQGINMYSQPERLTEKVALSCSLIDPTHQATWGGVGLIIQAPEENVCITQSSDAGTPIMSKSLLLDQARRNHVLTAEQLLSQTYPDSYNEVVTLANNEGRKIQLAGFFFKATPAGEPMSDALYAVMKSHADRLGLPIVPIIESNPYAKDKVVNTENSLYAHFNGKLYSMRGSDTYRFTSCDQKGAVTPYPLEEFESVTGFLSSNGVADEEIRHLRDEFVQYDTDRQKPKLGFNDAGQLVNIVKRSGYGADEIVMRIARTGDASWAYTAEESRSLSEAMADPTRIHGIEKPKLLSPEKVENLVQEAISSAPDEEKKKIEELYHSITQRVTTNWEQDLKEISFGSIEIAKDFSTFLRGFPKKSYEITSEQINKPPESEDK